MCRLNRPLMLLLVGWTLIASVKAEEQIPWQTDVDAALEIARQRNRPVLIHFWTEECGPCLNLEQTVFNRASVRETLGDFFVPVKVNANDMPLIAARYRIETVPKDVILSPDGREMHRLTTPQNAQQYIAQLSAVAFRSGLSNSPNQVSQNADQVAWNHGTGSSGNSLPPTNAYDERQNRFNSYQREADNYAQADATISNIQPAPTAEPQEVVNRFARQNHHVASQEAAPQVRDQQDLANYDRRPTSYDEPRRHPAPSYQTETAPPAADRYASRPQETRYDQPAAERPDRSQLAVERPQAPVAPPQTNPSQPPMGMDGYCPVSLLKKDAWVKGDPKYGVVHRGRVYLFAGPAEKEEFFNSPDEFSPILAGIDPVELAASGELLEGKRAHGVVYRKRVYLFSSEDHLKRFWDDPEQYARPIRQAMETGTVDRLFR